MNRLIENANTLDALQVSDGQTSRPRCGQIELIKGSAPKMTWETQCLLQRRLMAATLILLFSFGLFLVRRLLVPSPLWELHAVLVALLAITAILLARRCMYSMAVLRGIELAIFFSCSAVLLIHQYNYVLQLALAGDDVAGLAAVKSSVLYFFAIIIVYGMFIPNTWKRTAMVVIPMFIIVPLVMMVLRFFHPEVQPFVSRVATFEQVSDHILMLVIAVVCAVYGTHIINTLRVEAFEAKQLGQYRLTRRIGVGGMGEVYLAEHQLLKRTCAIKLIRPENAGDDKQLIRFEREVRATAKLSHPNAIDIYDYGRTKDGAFFYVMEYLPGMDLNSLVERYGPMPAERVVHLLRQICAALREAHDIGFVHRDIKPGNIIAAYRGGQYDVAKLLDFGLVKSFGQSRQLDITQIGTVTGSPLFMSPEQATSNAELDARSDIYSLGGVGYYLLTGQPPFPREAPMEALIAHARDPIHPPTNLVAGIPQELEEIIIRCLEKSPSERFQNVEELDAALEDCQFEGAWTQHEASQWWHADVARSAAISGDFTDEQDQNLENQQTVEAQFPLA